MVKNPPAMRKTWVWSLGWEDPLEKGKASHSSIMAWRIPRTRKESDMAEQLSLSAVYHRNDSINFIDYIHLKLLQNIGYIPCAAHYIRISYLLYT